MNTITGVQSNLEAQFKHGQQVIAKIEAFTKEATHDLMKCVVLPSVFIDTESSQAAIGQTIRAFNPHGNSEAVYVEVELTKHIVASHEGVYTPSPSPNPPSGESKYRFVANYGRANPILSRLIRLMGEVVKDINDAGEGNKVIAFRQPLIGFNGDGALVRFNAYDARFKIPFEVALYDIGDSWLLEVGVLYGIVVCS